MNVIMRLFKRQPRKLSERNPKKRWALLWGTDTLTGVCTHVKYYDTEEEAEIFYTNIANALPYAKTLVEPEIYDLNDPYQSKLFERQLKHFY